MAEMPVVNEFEVEALIKNSNLAEVPLFAIVDGIMVPLGTLDEHGRIDLREQLKAQREPLVEEVRQVVANRTGRTMPSAVIAAAHVKLIDTLVKQLNPEPPMARPRLGGERGGPDEIQYGLP